MKKYEISQGIKKTQVLEVKNLDHEVEFIVKRNSKLTLILTGRVSNEVHISINIRLTDRGAEAVIVGCFAATDSGLLKLTSAQRHEAQDTTSDLLVKSVVADTSSFFYNGIIEVARNAQKTNAYQRNENLLVSSQAHCDSRPTLEILANDVRCTHGATSGPISEEEMWYITSRGVSKSRAEFLIKSGFLLSCSSKIRDEDDKKILEGKIWELL